MKQLSTKSINQIELDLLSQPVGFEYRIKEISNIYARKNKNSISLIFRADALGSRIVKKLGSTNSPIDALNQQLLRQRSKVSHIKGDIEAPLTLSNFITLHFIPYSEVHHRDYKGTLSRLRVLATELGPIADHCLIEITKYQCIQVIERLRQRNNAPSTLNKYRYTLQSVFNLAVEMELIDKNPVSLIRKEPVSNLQTRVLRGLEMDFFIKYASECSSPYASCALLFLLFTGMRAMEALTMKWSYLSPDKSFVDLPMTKSGNSRRVQLNNSSRAVLKKLESIKMNSYIFYSNSPKGHLSYPRNALNWVCSQLSKEGVLNGPLTLHTLRHSFATNLVEKTGSLRVTQIALGHSSSVTTERYTHLSDKHINDSVLQLDKAFNYTN